MVKINAVYKESIWTYYSFIVTLWGLRFEDEVRRLQLYTCCLKSKHIRTKECTYMMLPRLSTLHLWCSYFNWFILIDLLKLISFKLYVYYQVVQLQELVDVRHSVFIIGNAGTGKTCVWKTLHRANKNTGKKPVVVDLNPKAVTNDELFGVINQATREWKDGKFFLYIFGRG